MTIKDKGQDIKKKIDVVFMAEADINIPLIGVTPNISWSIDPFGHSPTMAYFNKRSGVKAMVIQRIHFGIKRHLAKIKTMEFQWRQIWGKLDILFLHRHSETDTSLYTFSGKNIQSSIFVKLQTILMKS